MALIKGTLSLLVACSLLNGIFAISMLLIYHVVTYFVYKIKFFNHIKFHERSYFYMEQKQTSDPLVQYFSIYVHVYFKIVYSQKEKNIFLYWFCWLALFLESKQFHNNKIHIYDNIPDDINIALSVCQFHISSTDPDQLSPRHWSATLPVWRPVVDTRGCYILTTTGLVLTPTCLPSTRPLPL